MGNAPALVIVLEGAVGGSTGAGPLDLGDQGEVAEDPDGVGSQAPEAVGDAGVAAVWVLQGEGLDLLVSTSTKW
jgi:hypothetical protein